MPPTGKPHRLHNGGWMTSISARQRGQNQAPYWWHATQCGGKRRSATAVPSLSSFARVVRENGAGSVRAITPHCPWDIVQQSVRPECETQGTRPEPGSLPAAGAPACGSQRDRCAQPRPVCRALALKAIQLPACPYRPKKPFNSLIMSPMDGSTKR